MRPSGVADPASYTFEAVDSHILSFLPELVRDLGGDPDDVLSAAGTVRGLLNTGNGRPTYRQIVELLEVAAAQLQCPDFGMRLAKTQAGHIRSPLVALMESCDTIGEALLQVSRHSYAHSAGAAIWLKPSGSGERILVGHDILLEGLPQRVQAMEQILLIANLSIREIAGGYARARQVRFRHQPVSPLKVYRRYFGCEVVFGERVDALVFHTRDLDCPTAKPDAAAALAAKARIEGGHYARSPCHADVRGAVMRRLGTDECSNVEVARALGLHVRAMHRQLAAEGTSFQVIKNDVRRDMLLYYLEQTRLDLGTISGRLGFAEQSALTYFCRKWLSAGPSEIRSRAGLAPRFWMLSKTNKFTEASFASFAGANSVVMARAFPS